MTDTFDALRYLASYADLIRVYGAYGVDEAGARNHWEVAGKAEGRDPLRFDAYAYAAANRDVLSAFGSDVRSLTLHYVMAGVYERRPTTGFDAFGYAAANPDLIAAFGADVGKLTRHFVEAGRLEGRKMSFDAAAYGAANLDLARAFGGDLGALTRHYITNGFAEGRATAGFDALRYAASHPDLIRAFEADSKALTLHYLSNGVREGRGITFDASAYLAANPDLQGSVGTDAAALTDHYVRSGFISGRLVATAVGGAGSDVFAGTAAKDVLAGLAGNDRFVASGGDDRILGGEGVDTVDYSASTEKILIVRTAGFDDFYAALDIKRDSLNSIETFILGSGSDSVSLDGGADTVFGNGGDDQIFGRGGGDRLYGGEGNDTLSAIPDVSGPLPPDELYGQGGNDTLFLSANGGIADGGEGRDWLALREPGAGAFADVRGGAGIDSATLYFSPNIVFGSGGWILTDRTSGAHYATIKDVENLSLLPMNIGGVSSGVVNLVGQGGVGPVSFSSIGSHKLTGDFQLQTSEPGSSTQFSFFDGDQVIDAAFTGSGKLSISINGGTVDAVLRTTAATEFSVDASGRVSLGDGDDRMVVSGGTLVADGGGGTYDTLWILNADSAPVVIDMRSGTATATGISVTFTRFENAFSSASDDIIYGDDNSNTLRGLGGNDQLYGGDGAFDILYGREGDDLLVGGAGYDSLRGEDGNDLLIDRINGSLSGGEGDDRIVVLLDNGVHSLGQTSYVNTGAGADLVTISALVGHSGTIRITDFDRTAGDRLDLSELRDAGGNLLDFSDLLAAFTVREEGVVIRLDTFRAADGTALAGEIILEGVWSPVLLDNSMFVFSGAPDWQANLPTDFWL